MIIFFAVSLPPGILLQQKKKNSIENKNNDNEKE